MYKDFGDAKCHGTLLDLLCKHWDCDYSSIVERVWCFMKKEKHKNATVKPKQIKVLTSKEIKKSTKIQVTVRPWQKYDIDYWKSYGIDKKWLKYVEVYPISYKHVIKKDLETGDTKKYVFPAPKYSYVYVERKEGILSLKVYSPFDPKHKWYSCMDASTISLWTKVPEEGDTLLICSSLKDALCIWANVGIPAIAPQGEGYNISETALKELKRRFKKVYISYDGDEAGITDAKNLSEKTAFPIIFCPILDTPSLDREPVANLIKEGLEKKSKAKDWSDIFLYFGKERLFQEFNSALDKTNSIINN